MTGRHGLTVATNRVHDNNYNNNNNHNNALALHASDVTREIVIAWYGFLLETYRTCNLMLDTTRFWVRKKINNRKTTGYDEDGRFQ